MLRTTAKLALLTLIGMLDARAYWLHWRAALGSPLRQEPIGVLLATAWERMKSYPAQRRLKLAEMAEQQGGA